MVSLICPNCGSHMQLDPARKSCHCPFCDTEFIAKTDISSNSDFDIRAMILCGYKSESPIVLIPDGVKKIGDSCFAGMSFMESVSIPESVIEIGTSAFEGCSSLREVMLPSSLQTIGANAFKDTGLRHITLPESLSWIGQGAFMNCTSLESAVIPPNSGVVWKRTFKACSSLKTAHFKINDFFPSFLTTEETVRNGDKRSTICDAFQGTPVYNDLRERVLQKKCIICGGDLDKKYHCEKCGTTFVTGKTEGCYIATAVYGSYNAPQVWVLRRYRDSVLAKHLLGRLFIRVYYACSPALVKWFGNRRWFTETARRILDMIIQELKQR